MSEDLRDTVAAAARGTGGKPATFAEQQAAVDAFEKAEERFGYLADQNDKLSDLLKSPYGQAPLERLMGAAEGTGGDAKLLNQMKRAMSPAEFNVVGGQILHELGQNSATGEFSLAKFATNFNKLSPEAKGALFSAKHIRDIEDIAGLGMHIKGALRDANTSHSERAHAVRYRTRRDHDGGDRHAGSPDERRGHGWCGCRHPRRPGDALARQPGGGIVSSDLVTRPHRRARTSDARSPGRLQHRDARSREYARRSRRDHHQT
jgi:hypothetical protein